MPRKHRDTFFGYSVKTVEDADGWIGLIERDGKSHQTEVFEWELEARGAGEDLCILHQPVEERDPVRSSGANEGFRPVVFEYSTEGARVMTQVPHHFPTCRDGDEASDIAQQYIEARQVKSEREYQLRRKRRAEYLAKVSELYRQKAVLKKQADELKVEIKRLTDREQAVYDAFVSPQVELDFSPKRRPKRAAPKKKNVSGVDSVTLSVAQDR